MARRKALTVDQNNGNTEGQQKLADEVIDQYLAAKADKEGKGLHDDWATYDDYWRGDQNPKEDEDDPGSVTNIVHPLIESQVADLVDSPIDVTAKPWDYAGNGFKEQVERFIKWVMEWNRFTIKLERGERWRIKYGTSWGHVTYDPNENYPHGMIRWGFENPAQVFHDPKVKAPHLIDDAEFVILEVVKPLSWFKRNFPDKGEYVKQDTTGTGGGEIFDDETPDTSYDIGGSQARLLIRYSWSDDGYLRCVKLGGEDSRVILYDSDADEKLQKKENGKVVERKPWLKIKKYPLRPVVCYPKEGQVCGMGDIELIKPVQDLINNLDDQIQMNAQQMAWLIWFVSAGSRIKASDLNTRAAGTVIPVGGNLPPSQAVWALQPKEMPAYVIQRRETAKSEAERVSARPDVNQGFRPEGVNTFGGLSLLQQQGQKKSVHKQKMLLEHLGEQAEIVLEMAKQLFTETLPIPYEDADGEQQFAAFKASDLGAIPRFWFNPATGEWAPMEEGQTQEGKWRIHFSFGQGLPKDSAFQYQALLGLMQSSASQFLFGGLSPEDMHRVRKHLFGMVGVQIGDTPAPMPTAPQAGGVPLEAAAPAQQAPMEMQQQEMPQPGQGIPQQLQQALAPAGEAEMQAAWQSLDPRLQQALMAQFGGGA